MVSTVVDHENCCIFDDDVFELGMFPTKLLGHFHVPERFSVYGARLYLVLVRSSSANRKHPMSALISSQEQVQGS